MGKHTHNGPANPSQVLAALPGAEGCTVRENVDAGTSEVDVPGTAAAAIAAALSTIVYDANIASVEEALGGP